MLLLQAATEAKVAGQDIACVEETAIANLPAYSITRIFNLKEVEGVEGKIAIGLQNYKNFPKPL